MDTKYDKMTVSELESELGRLNILLEDNKAIRHFVLTQTGHHVSGTNVNRFEQELFDINSDISEVKAALDTKKEIR